MSQSPSLRYRKSVMHATALSLQLFSIRHALADDFESALREVAAIGFEAVEPFDFVTHADAYAALLPVLDLRAPSAHTHLLDHTLDPIFEAAHKIGASTVIDPGIPADRWTKASDIAQSAEALNNVAALAASYGIQVGYHNHWWEIENRIEDLTALEYFAGLLDPGVTLEVDCYWVEVGGVSAADLLERLGSRVGYVHIKDGIKSHDAATQLAVGRGELPIDEILGSLGAAQIVLELDDYPGDALAAMREGFEFVAGPRAVA